MSRYALILSFLITVPAMLSADLEFGKQTRWISLPGQDLSASAPVPQLRREFKVDKAVESATLVATAKGVYELSINGQAVSDAKFLPGWTDYGTRIYCHSFDVTDLLLDGGNAIAVMLGDGWYSGYLAWENKRQIYGETLEFLAELKVVYSDGTVDVIATDGQWVGSEGPIRSADFYNGEIYDARMEQTGWKLADFDASGWREVTAKALGRDVILEFAQHPPVREVETLEPLDLWEVEPGRWVFDLGQNMVGYAEIKVPSITGMEVTVRFAEMLEKDRTLYTANYRSAKSTDTYICAGGEGFETWKPTFTFHGFRYVELSGLPEDVNPAADWVRGIVLHNDFEPTGSFACSNPDLNQLQSNIIWGQKGNFLEVPTDCPQRDERLGWTGDAQVFCPTACFNFDVRTFYHKWMQDMRDAQNEAGAFPHVAPNVLNKDWVDSPAWADAGVIVPWEVYVRYGDVSMLEENYKSMLAWVRYQEANSPELVREERGFGDWLQPYPDPENGLPGDTSKSLIGTAYFAYTTAIVAKTAEILGNTDEAKKLLALREQIGAAFRNEFVGEGAKLTSDTQTAYLLALSFDLLIEKDRPEAVQHLLRLIDEAEGHLRTGFVGTPLLTNVLTRFGHTYMAYKILLTETYPGWIYSIRQGATTMWERWNSYSHEDGFGDAGMNSFNHYAYGAIGQWMYETVAGLKPDVERPGYRHFYVAPEPGGDLSWANARLKSSHGLVASEWRMEGDTLTMIVTVPSGTEATVVFPKEYRGRVIFEGAELKIDLAKTPYVDVSEGVHTFICAR